jgi:translation initiation factor IF-2
MDELDEEELQQVQAQKAKLKAMFREDTSDDQFCPIIIKSNMAGTLETLLAETQKIIEGHYQISIIETSVGPITEADIANAASTNAKIIAFDVPCSPII